jgi:DNA-directed RNA polymerase specialized sigma24 family protein
VKRPPQECAAAQQFLEFPNQDTFAREQPLGEDLALEVMLIVYRKAAQVRDRTLFRASLLKVARRSLCRHFGRQSREVETTELEKVTDRLVASANRPAAAPAFELLHWMFFLNSREGEALRLWYAEHQEIASAKGIPIGPVQWRVFNARGSYRRF